MRPHRRPNRRGPDISDKANRILNVILLAFVLIALRGVHLGVVQYDERVEASKRMQKKVITEPSRRGTIRDRFNRPLAINKVQYNAAILYSQIAQVPSIAWEKRNGEKVKVFKRREHIKKIGDILARELNIDPERLVDLIHSKASFYYHYPFTIKEDIGEREYYRLKMLEKDWPGIHVQKAPKRFYPMGRSGADVIGYMGAISKGEYESMIKEVKELQALAEEWEIGENPGLPDGFQSMDEVLGRLHGLQEHAYTMNDSVGKSGIEGQLEEQLRGFHGRKAFFTDAKGNKIYEMEGGTEPQSGRRALLTISSELQEFAETLLIQNEELRKPRVFGIEGGGSAVVVDEEPWIKGGAVVAMDPENGDVLALASTPRFDPNDFIGGAEGRPHVRKWFETEGYLGEVWDQIHPLERERFDRELKAVADEHLYLTWEAYLDFILPPKSPVRTGLDRVGNVGTAVFLQKQYGRIMELAGSDHAYAVCNRLYRGPKDQLYNKRVRASIKEGIDEQFSLHGEKIEEIKKTIDPFLADIGNNYDKVLLIDLCRLIVDCDRFSGPVARARGGQSLSGYRHASASFVALEKVIEEMGRDLFHEHHFKPWREANQKQFLKAKRLEEKEANKRFSTPYIDLLDKKEETLFAAFWEERREEFMRTFLTGSAGREGEEFIPYYRYFSSWHRELMQGAHPFLPWRKAYETLWASIEGLDQGQLDAYLRSFRRFADLNRPLLGKYRHLRKQEGRQLEKHLALAYYPRYGYGYGRSQAYRQATTLGSVFKIVTAYQAIVQRYQELNGKTANISSLNPLTITDDYFRVGTDYYVGYTSDGKPIPQNYKGGRIPRSHRAGLGKVDLIKALEVSSNPYFALLAGDVLQHPEDLAEAACRLCFGSPTGIDLPYEISGKVPDDLDFNQTGLYSLAVGQHTLVVTPLQTAVMLSAIANHGKIVKPKIVLMTASPSEVHLTPSVVKREVFMPEPVRDFLMEGMKQVALNTQTRGVGSLSKMYERYPEAIKDLSSLKGQLAGKSSTAECIENVNLDLERGTNRYNHIWFAGISLDTEQEEKPKRFLFRDQFGKPELVVVVYLRYGAWGKDAAPLAARIVNKWRKIKEREREKSV